MKNQLILFLLCLASTCVCQSLTQITNFEAEYSNYRGERFFEFEDRSFMLKREGAGVVVEDLASGNIIYRSQQTICEDNFIQVLIVDRYIAYLLEDRIVREDIFTGDQEEVPLTSLLIGNAIETSYVDGIVSITNYTIEPSVHIAIDLKEMKVILDNYRWYAMATDNYYYYNDSGEFYRQDKETLVPELVYSDYLFPTKEGNNYLFDIRDEELLYVISPQEDTLAVIPTHGENYSTRTDYEGNLVMIYSNVDDKSIFHIFDESYNIVTADSIDIPEGTSSLRYIDRNTTGLFVGSSSVFPSNFMFHYDRNTQDLQSIINSDEIDGQDDVWLSIASEKHIVVQSSDLFIIDKETLALRNVGRRPIKHLEPSQSSDG